MRPELPSLIFVEVLLVDDNHDDIRFTLLGREHVVDSFYLTIDDEFKRRRNNIPKADFIQKCLADLLTQWSELIRGCLPNTTVYLPFAFFDQGTGHLRVRAIDDLSLSLNVGWSDLEGWKLQPCKIADGIHREHTFEAELPDDTITYRKSVHLAISEAIRSLTLRS